MLDDALVARRNVPEDRSGDLGEHRIPALRDGDFDASRPPRRVGDDLQSAEPRGCWFQA